MLQIRPFANHVPGGARSETPRTIGPTASRRLCVGPRRRVDPRVNGRPPAVPLCCNPNHLEAVSNAENLRGAGAMVHTCPAGHPYDDTNTHYDLAGHRRCRQCNTDRYHLEVHGHEFFPDPDNPSTKRRRCLTCLLAKNAGQAE